jgi:FAD synthase
MTDLRPTVSCSSALPTPLAAKVHDCKKGHQKIMLVDRTQIFYHNWVPGNDCFCSVQRKTSGKRAANTSRKSLILYFKISKDIKALVMEKCPQYILPKTLKLRYIRRMKIMQLLNYRPNYAVLVPDEFFLSKIPNLLAGAVASDFDGG